MAEVVKEVGVAVDALGGDGISAVNVKVRVLSALVEGQARLFVAVEPVGLTALGLLVGVVDVDPAGGAHAGLLVVVFVDAQLRRCGKDARLPALQHDAV